MDNIDREIEKALSEEDRALAKQFEELSLIGQFKTVFQGPTSFVSIPAIIFGSLATIAFFYAAWQFIQVNEPSEKLLWLGGTTFLALWLGFMKVWFWMRMESNRVMREIKRVELQIARLGLNKS